MSVCMCVCLTSLGVRPRLKYARLKNVKRLMETMARNIFKTNKNIQLSHSDKYFLICILTSFKYISILYKCIYKDILKVIFVFLNGRRLERNSKIGVCN